MAKKQTKTFREMYFEEKMKPTAAQQFIIDAAHDLEVSEATIRLWLTGTQSPSRHMKDKIEKKYGAGSFKTLFPNAKS